MAGPLVSCRRMFRGIHYDLTMLQSMLLYHWNKARPSFFPAPIFLQIGFFFFSSLCFSSRFPAFPSLRMRASVPEESANAQVIENSPAWLPERRALRSDGVALASCRPAATAALKSLWSQAPKPTGFISFSRQYFPPIDNLREKMSGNWEKRPSSRLTAGGEQ